MAKKKIRQTHLSPKSVYQNVIQGEELIKLNKPLHPAINYIFKPHNFFTIVAFIFGTLFLVTTPPFQVADEIAHFGRVYKLSEFETIQKIENNVNGGSLPKSIGELSGKFRYLCWQPQNKTSLAQIKQALKVPLKPDKYFVYFIFRKIFCPYFLHRLCQVCNN